MCFYVPKIEARQFAIMHFSEGFTTRAGYDDRETVFAGWFQRWKNRDGWQERTAKTHDTLIDKSFVQ